MARMELSARIAKEFSDTVLPQRPAALAGITFLFLADPNAAKTRALKEGIEAERGKVERFWSTYQAGCQSAGLSMRLVGNKNNNPEVNARTALCSFLNADTERLRAVQDADQLAGTRRYQFYIIVGENASVNVGLYRVLKSGTLKHVCVWSLDACKLSRWMVYHAIVLRV
eukprot:gene3525-9566_t